MFSSCVRRLIMAFCSCHARRIDRSHIVDCDAYYFAKEAPLVRRCMSRADGHCKLTRFNAISLGMGGLLFAGTYCPVCSGIHDSPYGLFVQHRDDTNHAYQEIHMKASSATIYWPQLSRPLYGTDPIYLHNESNSYCLSIQVG